MSRNIEGELYSGPELTARVEDAPRLPGRELAPRPERELVLLRPPVSAGQRSARPLVSLLAAATPELYLTNAFRVLKKHVHVPLVDFDLVFGGFPPLESRPEERPRPGTFTKFHLEPTPTDLARARERLAIPEQRLIDEFFWFWPQRPGDTWDEGLDLLSRNRVKEGGRLWLLQEKQSGRDEIALHNLAVLYHLSALNVDLERLEREIDERRRKFGQSCWKQSMRRWETLLRRDGFWKQFELRAGIVLGPSAAPGFVDDFRLALPRALVSLQVQVARRASELGLVEAMHEHRERLAALPFDRELVEDAVEAALHPVSSRIWDLCEEFCEQAGDVRSPISLEQVTTFLDETEPLIRVLDAFLPRDAEDLTHTRDHVARAILLRTRQSGWSGDSGGILIQALEKARHLALDPELVEKIDTTLGELEHVTRVLRTCFFLPDSPSEADPEAAVEVSLHGDVGLQLEFGSGARMTWERGDFRVPRSHLARSMHQHLRRATIATIVTATMTAAILPLALLKPWPDVSLQAVLPGAGWTFAGLTALSLTLATWAWMRARRAGLRPLSARWEYPPVADRLREGWKRGDRPRGAPRV